MQISMDYGRGGEKGRQRGQEKSQRHGRLDHIPGIRKTARSTMEHDSYLSRFNSEGNTGCSVPSACNMTLLKILVGECIVRELNILEDKMVSTANE